MKGTGLDDGLSHDGGMLFRLARMMRYRALWAWGVVV